MVITTTLGLGGAFISLQVVEPEYQSSCKLFVAGRPDSGTGEGYQAAQFAQARVAAYLDLIKGARVAEGAINALDLDIPTQDLQQRISASAAAESVIITVSVTDLQSQRSADLANAVCNTFIAVATDAEGANPLVNVRVIEYAKGPLYPIGPSQKRYLAVGLLTGVLAGAGLIVALGNMTRSPRVAPPPTGGEPHDHSSNGRRVENSSNEVPVSDGSGRRRREH
ncbi:YveK family protein [Mycolicibacterium grossiae]|uniref:YveK family protein n=1 Tax=Mycolicibacterium grossiae TaxID=1552759 RepID=UPI0014791910|nr:hypothetical protein [Mycolicibacterium grossiae]